MILDDQQTQQLTNNGTYECAFTKQRFAVNVFDDPSPLGDIIVFEAPLAIGPIKFDKSLVLCGELPNTNIFGGVCFQRLYSAQVGSILSQLLEKPCYVNENCLFVEEKQTSITVVNQVKTSVLFHIFFPITVSENGDQGLFELKLENKKLEEFKQHCINCFYQLTKSLFVETQRDNV